MANVSISGLPEQTGKTNDDVLAIVDSGETTTSKIKVSTLLSGLGSPFIDADGTNNVVSDYYSTSAINSGSTENVIIGGTGNTMTDTSQYNAIIGGNGNEIDVDAGGIFPAGSVILGGYNHKIASGAGSQSIIGGLNNDISSSSLWNTSIMGGGTSSNAVGENCVMFGGNFTDINCSHGIAIGRAHDVNTSGNGGSIGGSDNDLSNSGNGGILFGDSNDLINSYYSIITGGFVNEINTGNYSGIVAGRNNDITHDRSVILGGSGLTSNYDDEVICEHLTTSGQSRGNFYNNLSGDTFTIDWDEGNLQKIYMTGATSLTFSNVKNGATYKLQVENGGSHSITGATASGFTILCEGGNLPNITNNGVDLCVLEVMDTDILVRHFANFSTP